MRRPHKIALLLAVTALAGAPASASAQVYFDDDPAKKEYGVPLEDARESGGGGTRGGGGGGGEATTPRSGSASSGGQERPARRREAASSGKQRAAAKSERKRKRAKRARRAKTSGLFGAGIEAHGEPETVDARLASVGTPSTAPVTVAALAAVLLPALLIGVARRRALRRR